MTSAISAQNTSTTLLSLSRAKCLKNKQWHNLDAGYKNLWQKLTL